MSQDELIARDEKMMDALDEVTRCVENLRLSVSEEEPNGNRTEIARARASVAMLYKVLQNWEGSASCLTLMLPLGTVPQLAELAATDGMTLPDAVAQITRWAVSQNSLCPM